MFYVLLRPSPSVAYTWHSPAHMDLQAHAPFHCSGDRLIALTYPRSIRFPHVPSRLDPYPLDSVHSGRRQFWSNKTSHCRPTVVQSIPTNRRGYCIFGSIKIGQRRRFRPQTWIRRCYGKSSQYYYNIDSCIMNFRSVLRLITLRSARVLFH